MLMEHGEFLVLDRQAFKVLLLCRMDEQERLLQECQNWPPQSASFAHQKQYSLVVNLQDQHLILEITPSISIAPRAQGHTYLDG